MKTLKIYQSGKLWLVDESIDGTLLKTHQITAGTVSITQFNDGKIQLKKESGEVVGESPLPISSFLLKSEDRNFSILF